MPTLDEYRGQIPAWCPGCGNFPILKSIREAMVELGFEPHQVMLVSGSYFRLLGARALFGRRAVPGRDHELKRAIRRPYIQQARRDTQKLLDELKSDASGVTDAFGFVTAQVLQSLKTICNLISDVLEMVPGEGQFRIAPLCPIAPRMDIHTTTGAEREIVPV